MKLSEAIREAVDTYLASDYEQLGKYLTLEFALFDILSHQQLSQLIEDEYELTILGDIKDRQVLRFMYAEFLALEAEYDEAAEDAENE